MALVTLASPGGLPPASENGDTPAAPPPATQQPPATKSLLVASTIHPSKADCLLPVTCWPGLDETAATPLASGWETAKKGTWMAVWDGEDSVCGDGPSLTRLLASLPRVAGETFASDLPKSQARLLQTFMDATSGEEEALRVALRIFKESAPALESLCGQELAEISKQISSTESQRRHDCFAGFLTCLRCAWAADAQRSGDGSQATGDGRQVQELLSGLFTQWCNAFLEGKEETEMDATLKELGCDVTVQELRTWLDRENRNDLPRLPLHFNAEETPNCETNGMHVSFFLGAARYLFDPSTVQMLLLDLPSQLAQRVIFGPETASAGDGDGDAAGRCGDGDAANRAHVRRVLDNLFDELKTQLSRSQGGRSLGEKFENILNLHKRAALFVCALKQSLQKPRASLWSVSRREQTAAELRGLLLECLASDSSDAGLKRLQGLLETRAA